MPGYVIEREVPGAGKLSQVEHQAMAQKSCNVIEELGPQVQWMESFVTHDKIYCIYYAPNKGVIKQHAEMGGFPADRIEEIKNVINPVTAEKVPVGV